MEHDNGTFTNLSDEPLPDWFAMPERDPDPIRDIEQLVQLCRESADRGYPPQVHYVSPEQGRRYVRALRAGLAWYDALKYAVLNYVGGEER